MDYQTSKAWPYVEARKLAERNITGRPAVFETGFGSSGLPTIATFAEVSRTTMVRHAYEDLMGYARNQHTRLIVFSDDADALRKVPDNIPNQEMLHQHLGKSLTRIPDPFGKYESFAAHNNAMLRDFLDRFGFDYEFMSATETYQSGRFNEALMLVCDNHDAVLNIIRPTLGEERRASYCAFMPILPSGHVIHDDVLINKTHRGLVNFDCSIIGPHGDDYIPAEVKSHGRYAIGYNPNNVFGPFTYDVRNGNTKLQWKVDWALRWIALGIDYEMCGKDLIDSVKLSSAIVRKLGFKPPVNMIYEMFLDEEGHKISKSKGNGLTIDEWLRYGSKDSLSCYLYRDPQKAKKLYPAIIPQAMDDYYDAHGKYVGQTDMERLSNPVHHVHGGAVPADTLPVTYQLLLNIAGTASVESAEVLAGYVDRAFPMQNPIVADEMAALISYATDYHKDFRRGKLNYRGATVREGLAFTALADEIDEAHLISLGEDDCEITDESIQYIVYEIGKVHYGKENLREWFKALYQCLLGQDSGPRFGAFAVLFGVDETINLLREHAAAATDEEVVY